jgi:predicted TIM-barrel fold metal-dependent hydrolase
VAQLTPSRVGPVVDCNVQLWDQHDNPVFWLSDRTLVRDMPGDYDSLPDRYAPPDYRRQTAGYDVRGVIRSGAGAADPLVRDNLTLLADAGFVATVEPMTEGGPMAERSWALRS